MYISYGLIFLGGGLGSVCRYYVGQLFDNTSIFWGTFFANILACLVLGLLLGYESASGLKMNHKLLFATGFCGGFSTFSTFSAEIVSHIQKGEVGLGLMYLSGSLIAGIIAIYFGYKIMEVAL